MRLSFIVFTILIIFVACDNRKTPISSGSTEMDSLLAAYKQEAKTNPANAMIRIREKQKSVKDSISYNKLNSILAFVCFMDNKIDSAIFYNKDVIQFCMTQNIRDPEIMKLETNTYNDIGVFYQIAGFQDSAIIYLEKAANVASKARDKNKLLDIYVNLADNYNQRSDFPSAASYYRKALFIADSLDIKKDINYIHTGLAHVYTDLKNFKEAEYYFRKVENRFDSLPDYDRYLFGNTRGNYYYSKHEYEKALSWFKKANSVSKRFAQGSYIATTEANLGEVYLLLNQLDSAKYYLDKASSYFLSDEGAPAAKFYIEGLYASYHLKNNNLEKAQLYLSRSYDTSLINPLYVYYNNKRLEDLYKSKGDYKRAYDRSSEAKAYDDSARAITIQNNIAEIDSRYRQDTIVLKRDIQLAHNEQKLLRAERTNILIISLFVIGILTLIIFEIYRRKQQELQRIRQLSVITKLRMESIQNRISPHFMFNVLNSVVPNLREYKNLTRPMELLIESIRGNLTISGKLAITLEEEIKIVKGYLALIESVESDPPEVQWKISSGVDLKSLVPSMILQIPVENAIKYAFEEKKDKKILVIDIYTSDNILNLEIKDNGVGFNTKQTSNLEKGTGTGLKVLYSTIEVLNVMNNKKMEFDIRNEVNISSDKFGTGVYIKIPLDYKYEL